MKSNLFAKVVTLICLICVLLSGCSILRELTRSDSEKALDASRPEGAERSPTLSDDITDVRVTIIPREAGLAPDFGKNMGIDASNMEFMQIYYGYCVNGVWTDLPCENYPLVGTYISQDYETKELIVKQGYEAADESHMVKIGPYLLFSIEARSGNNGFYTVGDSLGSEVILKFEEYDNLTTKGHKKTYGYVKEDHTTINDGPRLSYEISTGFKARYYVLVKYDELPEDYVLWIKTSPDAEDYKRSIPYDNIVYLLSEYTP